MDHRIFVANCSGLPQQTTPSAAALLFAAVLGFGAAWGWQMLVAVRLIPGVEVQPAGYWFVYGLIGAVGLMGLVWFARVCRLCVSAALNRRQTRPWETQDAVREYLLLRDCRNRSRQVTGTGGPCPSPKWKAYLNQNATHA